MTVEERPISKLIELLELELRPDTINKNIVKPEEVRINKVDESGAATLADSANLISSTTDFLRRSFRRSGRIGPHGQRRAATMYVVDTPSHKVPPQQLQAPLTRRRRFEPTSNHVKSPDSPGPERSGGTHIAATVKNTVRRLLRRTKSHRDAPTTTTINSPTTDTPSVPINQNPPTNIVAAAAVIAPVIDNNEPRQQPHYQLQPQQPHYQLQPQHPQQLQQLQQQQQQQQYNQHHHQYQHQHHRSSRTAAPRDRQNTNRDPRYRMKIRQVRL